MGREERMVRGADERFFAPAPSRARARSAEWRTSEIKLLQEHYPKGGSTAALAVLPGRSRKAIQYRAALLKLRAPASVPPAKQQRYESSPAIDAEIRRVYEAASSDELNALARRLLRPRYWITKRAQQQLGIVTPRFQPADWAPEEIALLEEHAHQSYGWLRTLLRRHGYKRTTSAIAMKVKRLGLDRTDPDRWTTEQLAPLMGVTPTTIYRWITEAGLPAQRRSEANRAAYLVSRADLRRWIARHAQLVDLRKVERYWFLDLAFGRATAP